MAIPSELESVLVSTPDTLSGAIRFAGTRVPVQCLLDTLDDGDGIERFLRGWPSVTRQQAEAVIRWEQDQARSALGLDLAG